METDSSEDYYAEEYWGEDYAGNGVPAPYDKPGARFPIPNVPKSHVWWFEGKQTLRAEIVYDVYQKHSRKVLYHDGPAVFRDPPKLCKHF